jgi:hypothetical protein
LAQLKAKLRPYKRYFLKFLDWSYSNALSSVTLDALRNVGFIFSHFRCSQTIVVSLPNALPQQMSLSRNFATGGEAKPTLLTGLQTSFKAGHNWCYSDDHSTSVPVKAYLPILSLRSPKRGQMQRYFQKRCFWSVYYTNADRASSYSWIGNRFVAVVVLGEIESVRPLPGWCLPNHSLGKCLNKVYFQEWKMTGTARPKSLHNLRYSYSLAKVFMRSAIAPYLV